MKVDKFRITLLTHLGHFRLSHPPSTNQRHENVLTPESDSRGSISTSLLSILDRYLCESRTTAESTPSSLSLCHFILSFYLN